MKKWLLPMFMMLVLVLAACGNKEEKTEKADEGSKEATSAETITYQSEAGPIEVPTNLLQMKITRLHVLDLLVLQ